MKSKVAACVALCGLVMAPATRTPAQENASARASSQFKSVADLQAAHDRAIIRDLGAYIEQNPKADDLEQAYMTLFNKAIDHDWFTEHEPVAKRYLAEQPDGAVRPLAQIVTIMARAQAGEMPEALTGYQALLKSLDRPEQEEFAINFADALASVASAAGDYSSARQIYRALLRQYEKSPQLVQKVRDDLARLDRVGRTAPNVSVKDLYGRPVQLESLRGKYVLIDFWATWCSPCVAELPNVQAAYAKYHDRGFEVIGVSLDETPGPVADFVKTRKLPWKQVHNASAGSDLVEAFGVSNIPATFLIDPEGTIVRLDLRGSGLDRALGQLVK